MKTQKEIEALRAEGQKIQDDLDALKQAINEVEQVLAKTPTYPKEPEIGAVVAWWAKSKYTGADTFLRWSAVHRTESTQYGKRIGRRDGWLMTDHNPSDSRWMTWEEVVDFARGLRETKAFGQAAVLRDIEI